MAKVGCIHLSFSYLLHHSVSTASCSMAVCTFHFQVFYTLLLKGRILVALYAPFILHLLHRSSFLSVAPSRCMHLSFLRLLHPKSVSVTHSPCCMHLSFSHILYRTLRRNSHQLAVCTFHFQSFYTRRTQSSTAACAVCIFHPRGEVFILVL